MSAVPMPGWSCKLGGPTAVGGGLARLVHVGADRHRDRFRVGRRLSGVRPGQGDNCGLRSERCPGSRPLRIGLLGPKEPGQPAEHSGHTVDHPRPPVKFRLASTTLLYSGDECQLGRLDWLDSSRPGLGAYLIPVPQPAYLLPHGGLVARRHIGTWEETVITGTEMRVLAIQEREEVLTGARFQVDGVCP